MRFVSLFAGVGGFDLGFERAGMTCVGQVEIDKKCVEILEKQWPETPRHNDVVTAREWADEQGLVGNVDLVCGGFPCQDVSVAGKRAGLAGERTGLFWDALAFASHVQARWVVLENVPGLLSSNQGRDFGVVISALADAGYRHIEWKVLDSQFLGVPQRRRRVFVVASVAAPSGRAVFVESEGMRRDFAESHTQEQNTSGGVGSGVAFSHTQGLDAQPSREAWPTLRVGGAGHAVSYVVRQDDTQRKEIPGWNPSAGSLEEGGVCPTLNAFDNGSESRATVIAFDELNNSLAGTHHTLRSGTSQSTGVIESQKVRRLTPVECERLQGFPDNWTEGVADTHRYKQMGNAVTVNVANYVGLLIMEAASESKI